MNCLVFDMDETLGFFSQISRLWFPLQELNNGGLSDFDFFSMCDLFPNILRPKIVEVLKYSKTLRMLGTIDKIILYTNNTGPEWWPSLIVKYIEHKAGEKLFDVIIPGYDKKNKKSCRRDELKTYADIVRCSKIPPTSRICFFDDQPHRKMENNKKVTTIFVNSYNFFYTTSEIFSKLKKLRFYKPIHRESLKTSLEAHLLEYNSRPSENTDLRVFINNFVKTVRTKSKKTKSKKGKSKEKSKKRKKATKTKKSS